MISKVEAILQLQSLREHCKEFNNDTESVWNKDIMALDIAIEALKQTPKSAIKTSGQKDYKQNKPSKGI